MGKPFKGTINVDIRDSVPDWTPFEPPKAPDGAPNVLYIVLDDVGFSAMSCYGGPIETPNIDRIAAEGVRYTQFHTTALCSPTRSCLLTGRNHTRNSMACITEAAIGFPNASGTIPPENGMLSEILGERGLEHLHGRQVAPVPDRRDEPRRDAAQLADRAAASSAGTGSSAPRPTSGIPDLVYDNHPVDQPKHARGGLPPHRGHHRQGDRVHPGRQGDRAGEAVLPLLRARRLPRAAPRAEGVDRPVQGPVRHGLRGDARADARPPEGAGHRPGGHRAAADQPDRHARDAHGPRRPAVPGARLHAPLGLPVGRREAAVRRMAEVYAGFLAHADHHIGRLLDYLEETGQRENTLVIVVSDNGASGEGGPNGSVNEMKFANGDPGRPRENLAMLDELGSPKTYNHYPNGWAMAFNTPFKMWKRYEFNGGTSDPCIISWPKGIGGARRDPRPVPPRDRPRPDGPRRARRRAARRRSRATSQCRFDGVSMRYSFDDAPCPAHRETQFYSMLGSRAIWHEGWKAVTTHPTIAGWGNFNDDEWELYHTDVDRSELHNLAAEQPDKAARARQPLVRGGRRQRRVPARRPLGAGDPDRRRGRS